MLFQSNFRTDLILGRGGGGDPKALGGRYGSYHNSRELILEVHTYYIHTLEVYCYSTERFSNAKASNQSIKGHPSTIYYMISDCLMFSGEFFHCKVEKIQGCMM